MKHIYIFLFIMASLQFGFAQNITTTPEFPTQDVPITIYFDASGTDLSGSSEDLYAHTGVTINGNQWQSVIGSWGENTTQPKFTKTDTDQYELEISPDISDFYSVSGTVTEICMVIRNESGDAQTNDIFISVYQETLDINVSEPDTAKIYSTGDEITVSAVALAATEMSLSINGTQLHSVSDNSINYNYTIDTEGNNTINISATDGTDTESISFDIFVRSDATIADLPQDNLKDGINYIDDNTVTLVLYAPGKEYVFVQGSFDDWTLGADNQMNLTPDGKRFWITLNDLTPQKEYSFQYIIDGEIYVADPYTDKVLDPWNDPWISDECYPDLIPYPSDYADGILSVFQTAQDEYQWQHTDFEKPAPEDLIIYELHIRDFIQAHDYSTLIDTFDYFKNLGINAIELMPVNEFEGNSSWGYNPSFYFAPDKYYGPKNDLKAFIDTCHANGIAVIIDMVLNHSYSQSPFLQMYFNPDAGEYGQPTADNPWYNETSPNPVYSWGYDFNHESEDTKQLVTRINRYWIEEYKVDGYRFDFTKGFTNTGGDGWAYDADRIQILKDMTDSIRVADENAYVILEHLADNSEEKVLSDYGMLLWGNMNHSYTQAAMGYSDGWSLDSISHKERSWSKPTLVGYMESHDEERMMYKNLKWGNENGAYKITKLPTALERSKLAATLFIPIPGPKMIWQFGELGYDISIDEPCRVCEKPIHWEYFEDENRYSLYNHYAQLIDLKRNNPVFSETDNFSMHTSGSVKQVVIEGSDTDVVVLGNFSVREREAVPLFSQNTVWYEYFTGSEYTASGNDSMTFNPGEYRIYSTQKLSSTIEAHPPVAFNLSIGEKANVGTPLTGTYSFYDADNDAEADSKYQWYRISEDTTMLIEGATELTYTPVREDAEASLALAVTPVSASDKLPEGKQVFSNTLEVSLAAELPFYPTLLTERTLYFSTAEYTEIRISDIFGKIVFEQEMPEEQNTVELPDLRNGLYIVLLKSENGDEESHKLVRKRPKK